MAQPVRRRSPRSVRAGPHNRLGEQPGALVTLVGRLVAEREADEVIAAAVGVEHGPRRVLNARLEGEIPKPPLARAARQPDPQEKPARGLVLADADDAHAA